VLLTWVMEYLVCLVLSYGLSVVGWLCMESAEGNIQKRRSQADKFGKIGSFKCSNRYSLILKISTFTAFYSVYM
jgi:hypothetical protein